MKKSAFMLVLSISVVAICSAGSLDSSFTYQGILVESGTPVDGTVDLRFSLWDAETGGAQVGPLSVSNDVAVSSGRVTTRVAFGDVMDGSELWLAVEVRDGSSTGAYTLLDPRQPLTAAPYAAHALEAQAADHASGADHATTAGHATSADTATNAANATTATSALTAGHATTSDSAFTASEADTLDGQHGAFYRSWSNLTGVPGGLDDGDNDTLADLACSAGEVASWDGSFWVCSTGVGVSFARTIVVGPVGDAAANGAALFAAVNSVTPASAADAVLIKVEPGEYDVTGFNFVLSEWQSLEGSGRLSTRIFAEACGSPHTRVIGLTNGELRDLTVENTCDVATGHAQGITVGGVLDGARMARVRVFLRGNTAHALGVNNDANDAFFEDVHVVVDGADDAVGIESFGTDVYLIDCIAEAVGVTNGTGFHSYDDARTVISRGYFAGFGSTISRGMYAYGASVDASDVGFAGETRAVSMYGTDGNQSGFFNRCDLHGQLWVSGDDVDDMSVSVRHSRIGHSGATVSLGGSVATVRVAGSELDGDAVIGPVECVAVWDEGTGFYPSTCP